jgi:hypothetical protein
MVAQVGTDGVTQLPGDSGARSKKK